jgi:hypothetical protein
VRNYDALQWRNSGYSARLGLFAGSIDARAFLPVILLLFHISWTTFYIFVAGVALFGILEFLGYSAPVAIRRLRCWIAGRRRYVHRTVIRRRRFVHG